MAKSYSYSTPTISLPSTGLMFRATSGGTVFTSVAYNATTFDYFDDSAVVDDAFYICLGIYKQLPAGFTFNVGTAIAATSYTLVWEYYKWNDDTTYSWSPIEDIVDNTVSFSVTGSNTILFPQQWQPYIININSSGIRNLWVRCRISALSGWTEGGANTTTVVKYGEGRIVLGSTTESDPYTFQDIYDWLIANQPHISISKPNAYTFDFTKVGFYAVYPINSTNEVILLGQNIRTNTVNAGNVFSYLLSGTKVGTSKGYGGSTFIIYGLGNQSVFTLGTTCKIYGATFRTGKPQADANSYAGYCTLEGEIIDCNIELSTKVPESSGSIINNCRITGGLLIAKGLAGTYSNISYLCTQNSLFYIYTSGFTLEGFDYSFKTPSSACVFYLYQGSTNVSPEWVFLNPKTPLNQRDTFPKPITLGTYRSLATIQSVKYYDSSAGTYTDYTTQAQSAATSDVPLDGDVGDIYYFGKSLYGGAYGSALYMTLPTQSNDYEYAWEYYYGGIWNTLTSDWIWDSTYNMTQTGYIYFGTPSAIPQTTIDSVASYWIRARITAKGSATPKASLIQQECCSTISNWSLKEKYTLDINVIDSDGNAIDGATVTVVDENGDETFSVDTDENGNIDQQQILAKEFHFDPVNEPSTGIAQNIYSYITLTVSKNGYETYREIMSYATSSAVVKTVALKQARDIMFSTKGQVFAKVDATNNTEDRELLIPITG